jgi:hypothetical protein
VSGVLDAGAVFAPDLIDFGTVTAGRQVVRRVTVTIAPRLLPAGARPLLMTSDTDIYIRPVPASETAGAGQPQSPPFTGAGGPAGGHSAQYDLVLRPRARLGIISGIVSLAVAGPGNAVTPTNITVPLQGDVRGAVAARPEMIMFGMVTAGVPSVQNVALTTTTANILAGARIASGSPYLSAQIVRVNSQPAHFILKVILSKKAPAGSLETQITVIAADGEELLLPASAYVVAAHS